MNDDIYEPGEVYNITIKGARVISVAHNGWIRFDVPDGPRHEIAPYSDAFTVERVAPAEWPPRPGDLWRDGEGDVWFAVEDRDGDVHFRATGDTYAPTDWAAKHYAPLTLVHREDEPDAASNDKPSLYADLVGERVGVQRTDGEYLTGVLTVADTYAVTVKVDRPVNGVPNRDVRAEDIATMRRLPTKDGGAS